MTTTLTARRGFLRGLCTLPLVGGGVTLIGNPTGAAVPVTPALLNRYVAWLVREHAEALVEHRNLLQWPGGDPSIWHLQPLYWFPQDPVAETSVLASRPSTRAAAILAAAGCDWKQEA